MEEESVELITEWPVTGVCSEDDTTSSPSLSTAADRCQKYVRRQEASNDIGSGSHKRRLTHSHSIQAYVKTQTSSEKGQHKSFTETHCDEDVPHKHAKLDFKTCPVKITSCSPGRTSNDSAKESQVRYSAKKKQQPGLTCFDCGEDGIVGDNVLQLNQCSTERKPESFQSFDCNKGIQDDNKLSHFTPANRSRPPELLVQPRIARWWRRQGQHLVAFEQRTAYVELPSTTNPNTMLFHVARLPDGRSFLKSERCMLKKKFEGGQRSGDVMAAVGSIEDWLGNPEEAVVWIQQAVEKEPHNTEWKWLLQKVLRQQRLKKVQAELITRLSPRPVFPQSQHVERVSCKTLSFSDFLHNYALRRKPVIITDMVETMTTIPWDLQHIRDVAGDCEATVKQFVPGSVEWAGLEESKTLTVSQFLSNLRNGCKDYLFDWSLPLHCPRLCEELTIPRYFAGDFLQRSNPGSLYRDSWPSLFIADSGVHGGLHVDAFASNFWMALFQGRKRWIFFHPDDLPCLYPVYAHSLDPTFEAKVTEPDLEAFPLLSLVHPVECILNAGEILFVPGGSPHCVENLETSLAISANFVDLSNFTKVLDELEVNALIDPRAADLAQQFQHPKFLSAMKSDMKDLSWADYKTWPPADVENHDLT